jgi:ectoine hydroxylase-related dioxygenase (phytanoyl-CoA dioxygenase family)
MTRNVPGHGTLPCGSAWTVSRLTAIILVVSMTSGNEHKVGGLAATIEQDGFAIVPQCLDANTVEQLCKEFNEGRYPERNLLSVPSIRNLARSSSVREIVQEVLGKQCFAVRGIFFNKTRSSNWRVAWHQDLTIAVRERIAVEGFGPWTMKSGAVHVQPPAEIMSDILAIRLHLDESGPYNGPLRVMRGSHRQGRLSAEQTRSWEKANQVTCTVPRGGALVMRPLLLHTSSSCVEATSRRVIHFEFASTELPQGLNWKDKV